MLFEYEVTLSMRPLMVTFGAGAWAYAKGAARATRAKAIIRTARLVLFIETLLNQVDDDAFLQRLLADRLRYARQRYVWRDECFPLSPPREKRIGKGLTFLPRSLFTVQGKIRRGDSTNNPTKTTIWAQDPSLSAPHLPAYRAWRPARGPGQPGDGPWPPPIALPSGAIPRARNATAPAWGRAGAPPGTRPRRPCGDRAPRARSPDCCRWSRAGCRWSGRAPCDRR